MGTLACFRPLAVARILPERLPWTFPASCFRFDAMARPGYYSCQIPVEAQYSNKVAISSKSDFHCDWIC
jgi:hypothetical protein